MKDYYSILGVEINATPNEIAKAYRKLAKKFHPDHNPDDPFFESRFKDIKEAYETLGDETKRKVYDELKSNNGAIEKSNQIKTSANSSSTNNAKKTVYNNKTQKGYDETALIVILFIFAVILAFIFAIYAVNSDTPKSTATKEFSIPKVTNLATIPLGSKINDVKFIMGKPNSTKKVGDLQRYNYDNFSILFLDSTLAFLEYYHPKGTYISEIGFNPINYTSESLIKNLDTPFSIKESKDALERIYNYPKRNLFFFLKENKVYAFGMYNPSLGYEYDGRLLNK